MEADWKWSVSQIPPRERFGAWFEIMSATYLAFAIETAPGLDQDIAADVHENKLGAMSLFRTSVLPHRGRRTWRHVAANSHDVVGLHFVRTGKLAAELDGERVLLGPGDALIWDGATTGRYEILEPLVKTTLIVPRSLAATVLPRYRQSSLRTVSGQHAPSRSLVRLLTLLDDQLPSMTGTAREAAARLVAEMLKPLDHAELSPALRLREQILAYIDANLGDAKLSVATVAAAHGISVRTLYAAFDGLGVTPAGYVRNRRLTRSYDDLLFGADPVGEVATRWCFVSPAHFSRAFRNRYGVSPIEVRRHGQEPPVEHERGDVRDRQA
ncbi:helix-turn-helix domain-containing protein [Actinoplanes sp. TBRC 11911]|uniref:helix-turn-helix domain-containing protein n=1 Tax=Actinoplanes sp. TBRC 11911 TaxID=2729386 RepID=UPI00145F8D86|nr:helix-turn-helix domain-containing protein [Actinoplanes sp. TBRC 11911]NMO50029.1 helix-turn-helix domain-containing protein [Actinoplanes sp. TBRC 11911]